MEHKSVIEETDEEFVDCPDPGVFIDKIIEDCITADPFPDHLPVACGEVEDTAGLKTQGQGYVNVNLNQNDHADRSTYSSCEKSVIPRHLDPMFEEFGLGDLLDENISLIRRSQSDDLLSGSTSKVNQESLQRSTNSEKNISNLISPTEQSSCSTFSKPFNVWTNDDDAASSGSEVSSENIDFSAEFDRRIDLLESADYALEEAFFMLRGCVEKLQLSNGIGPADPTTEHEQDMNVENVPKITDLGEEEASTVTQNIKVNKKGEEEDTIVPKEEETRQEGSRDAQDNKLFKELLTLIVGLESKLEHFMTGVGDLVQLGAFSVKHAVKVEQFGRFMKSMYVKLRMDNEKMQEYIHDKEAGWNQTQARLHSEIVRQTDEIQVLMTELSNSSLQNRIRKQMQDRHVSPVRKEMSSTENIVNLMLHQRCSVEKAMALDFSRQSKINELKLLVLQQQSYIQKLEVQNKEMDVVIQGMLSTDDEPKEPPKEYQNVSPLNSSISMVSDVLFCDHAPYLVDKSTDCSLVSEQVFQIGDSIKTENRLEAVFDPQRLSYVRSNIREQEGLETEASLTLDIGSGESGGINGVPTGSELEAGVQESKQKQQEPDEPAPSQDNMV